MRKRLSLTAAACILILSGCVNKENYREQEPTIVLTVLAGQSTSDAGIEDMIDEWMRKEYPNVRLEWECVDWGERFSSQMRGKIAAGDMPDIVIGKAQDVQIYAKSGQLGSISRKCREKIKKNVIEFVEAGGKVYGIPYNALYQGVIYNKDIFERLNLQPPRTQEELNVIIEQLKSAGIEPFAAHFQENWETGNMMMQYMMNEIFRYDHSWGDKFRAGTVNFQDNEDIKSCIMNHKKMLDATWKDALLLDQFESDSRFIQGEAAMYLTGTWSLQFTDQYGEDMRFGIFPYPNRKGDADLIQETNLTFMKSANSKYDKLIDKIFYSLLEDKKMAQEILDFTQSFSLIEGMEKINNSKIQEDIDWYKERGKVIDATIGNKQLIWEFQNSFAQEQVMWLKNEKTMEQILNYADENRADSAYVE